MKQRIKNYTQYTIALISSNGKNELLTTDSLQVAAVRLREYALKYADFLRTQREINQSAWLALYVLNLSDIQPTPKVVCRIGAVYDMSDLCMI